LWWGAGWDEVEVADIMGIDIRGRGLDEDAYVRACANLMMYFELPRDKRIAVTRE
jgi:hypothetical protein